MDTANLNPGIGGSLGRFSTSDDGFYRHVRVFANASGRTEELALRGELRRLAARIQVFPAELLLKTLGREIVAEFRSRGLPIDVVHIEVWRIDFGKGDLDPRSRNVRRFAYHAGTLQ